MILIAAALPEELAALHARVAGARRARAGGRAITLGRVAGRDVALAVLGEGPASARAAAEVMAHIAPELLVVAGAAGGLTRDLAPAALLVARAVVAADGVARAADAALVDAASRATGARPGVLVTAAALAEDPAAKRALLACVGSESSAAVDLESAGLVAAAAAREVPWVVLRAISDTADEALPSFLARCRRDGATSRALVVGHALIHPTAIPHLVQLGRRIGACAEALSAAVVSLVASIGTAPHVASPE